jgi:hypothetical protein
MMPLLDVEVTQLISKSYNHCSMKESDSLLGPPSFPLSISPLPSLYPCDAISPRCVLEETQLRRSLRDLEGIADDGEIILEKIRQPDSGHQLLSLPLLTSPLMLSLQILQKFLSLSSTTCWCPSNPTAPSPMSCQCLISNFFKRFMTKLWS